MTAKVECRNRAYQIIRRQSLLPGTVQYPSVLQPTFAPEHLRVEVFQGQAQEAVGRTPLADHRLRARLAHHPFRTPDPHPLDAVGKIEQRLVDIQCRVKTVPLELLDDSPPGKIIQVR